MAEMEFQSALGGRIVWHDAGDAAARMVIARTDFGDLLIPGFAGRRNDWRGAAYRLRLPDDPRLPRYFGFVKARAKRLWSEGGEFPPFPVKLAA